MFVGNFEKAGEEPCRIVKPSVLLPERLGRCRQNAWHAKGLGEVTRYAEVHRLTVLPVAAVFEEANRFGCSYIDAGNHIDRRAGTNLYGRGALITAKGLQMFEEQRTDALALDTGMDGQELDPTAITSHHRGTESFETRVVHREHLLHVGVAEDRSLNGRRCEQVVGARYSCERGDLRCVIDSQRYGRFHKSIM